jgi:hypothetical protein
MLSANQTSTKPRPPQDQAGSGIGGQVGGLASFAGVNLGGGEANKTTIAKAVLQSRAFLTEFIHRHSLSVDLMAAEGWNKGQGKWIYDKEIYSPATGEWAMDSDGKSLKPTDCYLVKAFKEQLSVTETKDNGMNVKTEANANERNSQCPIF